MIQDRKLSSVQIEVVNDYFDLLRNGYINLINVITDSYWFIKVRHLSNGRIIVLKWNDRAATMSENRHVIKDYMNATQVC